VRALFKVARARQPAVIFIDEIDSLLSARSHGEHEASRRLKTEFMVQLDGVCSATNTSSDSDRLLVMGATNLPHELDEAVLRRLARRVYVPLPDAPARTALISHLLKGQKSALTSSELAGIVARSEGYSCSDLATVSKEAAMQPLRDLGSNIRTVRPSAVRAITAQDFVRALSAVKPTVSAASLAQFERWESR
jgi:SpoVK/Ycf46/Vps4 family AAA+-type ATPase